MYTQGLINRPPCKLDDLQDIETEIPKWTESDAHIVPIFDIFLYRFISQLQCLSNILKHQVTNQLHIEYMRFRSNLKSQNDK